MSRHTRADTCTTHIHIHLHNSVLEALHSSAVTPSNSPYSTHLEHVHRLPNTMMTPFTLHFLPTPTKLPTQATEPHTTHTMSPPLVPPPHSSTAATCTPEPPPPLTLQLVQQSDVLLLHVLPGLPHHLHLLHQGLLLVPLRAQVLLKLLGLVQQGALPLSCLITDLLLAALVVTSHLTQSLLEG